MFEGTLKLRIVTGKLSLGKNLFLVIWGLLFGVVPALSLNGALSKDLSQGMSLIDSLSSHLIFLVFPIIGLGAFGLGLRNLIRNHRFNTSLKKAKQTMPYTLYLVDAKLTGLSVNDDPEVFLTFEGESGMFEHSIYVSQTVYSAFEHYLSEVNAGERQPESLPVYLIEDTLYMSRSELISNIGRRWSKASPLHKDI